MTKSAQQDNIVKYSKELSDRIDSVKMILTIIVRKRLATWLSGTDVAYRK